jgi:hypothetical protein
MTLEQILKSRGWSDADLESVKPLLTNDKFRSDLEAQYGAVATERDTFRTQLEAKDTEIEDWRTNTVNPRIAAAEQEAVKARTEAALLREQVQIAKDYGLIPEGEKQSAPPTVTATAPTAFDPKQYKLVTQDDVARFADLEGQAIAMAGDLAEEYRYLSGGKSLYDYVAPDGKRGLSALRAEAIKSKKPLNEYVAEKMNFASLRTSIAEKQQAERDKQISEAAVRKYIEEHGANPLTRTPNISRAPLIPVPATGGKQPWDVPLNDRRNARQERAMVQEMKVKAG